MQSLRVSRSLESDNPLSRSLDQEERRAVQDLASHPGFQLFLQVCQASMVQAFNQLRRSKDRDEMLRAQAESNTYEAVLAIPAKLLERATERRQRFDHTIATVPPED